MFYNIYGTGKDIFICSEAGNWPYGHLNSNKQLHWNIVVMEYSPLNDTYDQIRLLTILPEVDFSNPVHCTVQTVSLQDLTPNYRHFLSCVGQVASKRQLLSQWLGARNLPSLTTTTDQVLQDAYRYTWGDLAALSYTWGPMSNKYRVFVNGYEVRATENLVEALRALRAQSIFQNGLFQLWVDAICINQDDQVERGHQVLKMRNIFGYAFKVVTWLGIEANAAAERLIYWRLYLSTSRINKRDPS